MWTPAALILLALLPQAQAARKVARRGDRRAPSQAAPAALATLEEQKATEFGKEVESSVTTADQAPGPVCIANNILLSAVSRAVNGVLNRALIGRDPRNFSFQAYKNEVNLYLCKVGVQLDVSAEVQGFANAGIGDLACLSEECLEPEGQFGLRCAKKEYTFSGKVLFAKVLNINGESSANFDLCGLESNLGERSLSFGLESAEPGIDFEFVVTRTGGARIRDRKYSIKLVSGLETSWGTLQNFKCDFASDFVGSYLESWCTSIVQYVAERAQTRLEGEITRQLLKLVSYLIDVPEDMPEEAW